MYIRIEEIGEDMDKVKKIINTATTSVIHTKENTWKETIECLPEAFEEACIRHNINPKEIISYSSNDRLKFEILKQPEDMKLKMEMQSKLFKLFNRREYTSNEIRNLLGINQLDVYKLCKHIKKNLNRKYDRVDIVRVCMGGMLFAD
ncbi:hypothetical protein [Oceanirhabdus sp. W0125-5]|uniref:hypothetical protein n=1 Tax=Oceanirhabdus sp. W0125-5 TaxID=2999116 RepID=UPI0022F3131D|nr:hypothetical protein [Oceanirhabdus sp. W0125-5]WBW95274.1 hypothetical protein OW730_16450 [Oceanirhabdus sp. W0125-5]